jgi:hypothetical protein
MQTLAPKNPKDRFEVYRFFNGLSAEAREGLDQRRARVPLVKTFLLEHVAYRGNVQPKQAERIFRELGADVRKIEDCFMGLSFPVQDESGQTSQVTTGFVEQYDERFFAYYTCELSAEAKERVGKWVLEPDLDHSWFSSPLLQALWDLDVSKRGDDRYAKLGFCHESKFDIPEDFASLDETSEEEAEETSEDEETTEDEESSSEDRLKPERYNARFQMADRIREIKGALSKLQDNYAPLHVIDMLRLPSHTGHGGHDLYQNGQITNRTDSFEDHRNTVRYLYRIYKSILERTEESAWHGTSEPHALRFGTKGTPLIVNFPAPLSEPTFNRWVEKAFRKKGPFKLWGNPMRLGPTKVHVYGADRHLWQPINLEMTSRGIVAILPKGTCGNTFHRLVTNIQRYVCPDIRAWIGSEPFKDMVRQWPANVEESDAA